MKVDEGDVPSFKVFKKAQCNAHNAVRLVFGGAVAHPRTYVFTGVVYLQLTFAWSATC
jgi:hypothetical protein